MAVKIYFSLFTLAILIAALSACGGSGSSTETSDTPDTPQEPFENVPPSVVSVSPVNGSNNVSRSASITATFDEALFALSIDDTSFTLSDSNNIVSENPQLNSETASTISLTGSNLRYLTPYTATLETGITDLAGNPLAEAYSWYFTTEDGQWGTAQEIDSVADSAIFPQLSSDPSGNAIAVWMQKHEGQYRIWTNRYDHETDNWTTASLIENTATEGSAQYPQIAMDNNGNGLAVWKQEQGINSNTYTV